MSNGDYVNEVQGETSENLLAKKNCADPGPIGEYLRTAAQVRSRQELIVELMRASADSGELQRRLFCLTRVIASIGLLQAIATAWPYLAPWAKTVVWPWLTHR